MLFNALRIIFAPPKRRKKPTKIEVVLTWTFVVLFLAVLT